MEFLMTYGWAILVVLAAIGALAYFGVLSPSGFLPESCVISSGIGCDGFKVTPEGFAIVIKNSMGKNLMLNSAEVGGCTALLSDQSFNNGEQVTVTTGGCNFLGAGERFDADIKITYTEKTTGLEKYVTGSMNAKISSSDGLIGGGTPVPVTLVPTLAESYQDEGTSQHTVTNSVTSLDDSWAPIMTGTVNIPYYATGTSDRYFDALAVKFNTASYDPGVYDATLRLYIREGSYSGGWHHYKIYDDYKGNSECYDSGPCGGATSWSNGYEGWMEKSISDSIWDDGEFSIRIWNAYVDKVELYLVPS